jgi:hypothetical protein
LFWRHGCSAARNSPACKGKSLRCLRKCRLSYIDTSPAPSARRHLTAALWGPSRLHLGFQTHPHQTWCAPRHLGVVGRLFSAPNSKLFAGSARPIQNFLPGTTVAIVGVSFGRMARPGRRLEPNARLCVAVAQVVLRSKLKAGCVAIEVKRQKTSTSSVSVREPPSPAQAGLLFGALLTPRGDVFAFKGASPSTGSSTVTVIKSQSS